MAWRQLLSIYQEAADDRERERTEPVLACPNDGTPLKEGPNGIRFCPFDGWKEGDN